MRADGAKIAQWSTLLAGITASGENPTSQRALEAMCAEMLASLSSPQEPVACKNCKGRGTEADYVGLEMNCVEVECSQCKGTGFASPVEPVVVAKAEAEGGAK